jgi:hypothetical protein
MAKYLTTLAFSCALITLSPTAIAQSTDAASARTTVIFTVSPAAIESGQSATLSWEATNATECRAGDNWWGYVGTSGSRSTGALQATSLYRIKCSGPGGNAVHYVTVSVSDTTAPTVVLTASPASVASGSLSTLTWNSTNASNCTASGTWNGTEPASGSQNTSPLTVTTTYTLTCSGAGGSASQSAMVSVTNPGSVALTWVAPTLNTDGSAVTPLSGYTLYYGTSSSALTSSTLVSGSTTTSYTLTGLSSGTWYFAVAANAADGTQSALSNVASNTI